ncbi:MAG: Gfo/Idh/MocA family oxidoreductase, partial [Patescibacteria group bacterium]
MIKAAVVGFGYWGPNHVRNLLKLATVKAVCVCDSSSERLEAAKSQYPDIQTAPRFDDIVNDSEIEAVVIALPAALHFDFAKKALLAGKNVLVEKPLTLSSEEARELVDLAEKQKKVLMVGSTFLYNDGVREIKKYIDNGDLGDIYHIYFQRLNWGKVRQDVNAMWNLAPHDISMTLYWLGEMPRKVMARGAGYLQKDIEDIVFLNMEFKDKKMV